MSAVERRCVREKHEELLNDLKSEVVRLETELADANKEVESKQALLEEERSRHDEAVRISNEKIAELGSGIAELQKKMDALEGEIVKRLKGEGRCFDVFQRIFEGRSKADFTLPELLTFGLLLMGEGRPPGVPADTKFTTFFARNFEKTVEPARRMSIKVAERVRSEMGDLFC